MSKYGVVSGPYFLAFGPEETPYLNNFHAVFMSMFLVYFEVADVAYRRRHLEAFCKKAVD